MAVHFWTMRLVILGAPALLLAACATPVTPEQSIPTFPPKQVIEMSPSAEIVAGTPRESLKMKAESGPTPPASAVVAANRGPALPPNLNGAEAEALSLEQVSLPTFIDEVFSKALKLNVQLDPSISSRTDLVTLRTGRTLPADELFVMAKKVLEGYGIGLTWDGSVLHVATDATLMAQMPELIRSRALPELPLALRPIFQFVDLHQVSQTDMTYWLANAFGTKIRVFASPHTDSIMIFGLPNNVQAAVNAVHVLDQARLAGRKSLRISPVFWTSDDMATKLVELLRAEGYDASATAQPQGVVSAVTIVPVPSNNSLIVFSADPEVLAHARQWAADLDQPAKADPLRSIFVYQVQNTTATSLGPIVQAALGQQRAVAAAAPEARLEQSGQTSAQSALLATANGGAATRPAPTAGGGASGNSPRIIVDQARNALIFIGTAQEYQGIRPLLEALDKAPREALIEVTVAELTLDDSTNLGVEWTLFNHVGKGLTQSVGTGNNVTLGSGGTAGGLPLGTTGFNYAILNSAAQVRLLLNAFAQNNHLSVLSTPRVLAKSGGSANIEVGTEVPIVTSQGTTNQVAVGGNSGILQTIEYRKTGVLLTVTPIVHSGNRIDLTVSQEVSAALPNSTPGISSPLIQNRDIKTDLTLTDGSTVVIGGMIQDSRTNDDAGVPLLKDIPGLGLLFRNQSVSRTKTELLVFITPYVVSNDSDAAAITQDFRNEMKGWAIPDTQLHW